MRIAVFTELYPPHIGGQEIRYAELSEALLRNGHSVDVFCIRHTPQTPPSEVVDGVTIYRHPLAEGYLQPSFKMLRRELLPTIRYAWWCRRVAAKGDYDFIIYNQWPLLHLVLAPMKARKVGVIDWCEVRNGKVFRFIQSRFPKLMKRNIAVSSAVAEHIRQVSGREVEYVPSGIWSEKYSSAERSARSGILYVGRVAEHKNIGLLIDTFALLKQRGYAGRLVVAGSGPWIDEVARLAASSQYSSCIDLLGYVDDQKKLELLSSSEILAMPSRREGFPRVVAEAIASGLPVATVDYPENGTKTVVKQYEAGLVSAPTAEKFADSIQEILASWQKYSKTALRSKDKLDWSALIDVLLGTQSKDRPDLREMISDTVLSE